MIGRVIGNYQIQQKLGEGGMGSVYRAVDLMLDRDVAIKVLRPELIGHSAIVERFRAEAVTLAKLHHPNIATLFNLLREEGEMMMVMEFVRGQTLDNLLEQLGTIAPGTAVAWCCQVLDAMHYAHRKGVVHRDIKPANLMITDEGLIKVTDFGIARVLGERRKTRTGHIIGTITYMSPEQIRGQDVDARADLYSLGAVLFELLTGRPPFTADNEFSVMNAHINTPAPLVRDLGVDVPDWLDAAMQRALAKGPLERFQTATDFRAMLADGQQSSHLSEEARVAEHVVRHVEKVTASGGQPPPTLLAGTPESETPGGAVPPPTRLASAAQPPPTRLAGAPGDRAPGGVKETRLAGATPVPAGAPAKMAVRSEGSLLQQLTWRHYAGAGAILVILTALAVAWLRPASARGSAGQIETSGPPAAASTAPQTKRESPATTPGFDVPARSGEGLSTLQQTTSPLTPPAPATGGLSATPLTAGTTVPPPSFPIQLGGKTGFVDRTGKVIINPQYDEVGAFAGGFAWIKMDRRYGYIDRTGRIVVTPQFSSARDFREGLACVELDRWGFVSTDGRIAINPQFDRCSDFHAGLAAAQFNRTWGYVNKAGKIVINPQFDEAGDFSGGLAPVSSGGRWGYVDGTGKIAINQQFEGARDFREGLAPVLMGDSWGYVDSAGAYRITPQFHEAWAFSEGLARVDIGGRIGFVDRTGKLVINPQFETAGDFHEGLAFVVTTRRGQYGFVDKAGRIVINPQFDEASDFVDGLAKVKVGRAYGYVDKAGKYIYTPTR
jgi:serine/threonine-protein kinase